MTTVISVDEKARKIWAEMTGRENDNLRVCNWFPNSKIEEAEREGFNSQELYLALMQIARRTKGNYGNCYIRVTPETKESKQEALRLFGGGRVCDYDEYTTVLYLTDDEVKIAQDTFTRMGCTVTIDGDKGCSCKDSLEYGGHLSGDGTCLWCGGEKIGGRIRRKCHGCGEDKELLRDPQQSHCPPIYCEDCLNEKAAERERSQVAREIADRWSSDNCTTPCRRKKVIAVCAEHGVFPEEHEGFGDSSLSMMLAYGVDDVWCPVCKKPIPIFEVGSGEDLECNIPPFAIGCDNPWEEERPEEHDSGQDELDKLTDNMYQSLRRFGCNVTRDVAEGWALGPGFSPETAAKWISLHLGSDSAGFFSDMGFTPDEAQQFHFTGFTWEHVLWLLTVKAYLRPVSFEERLLEFSCNRARHHGFGERTIAKLKKELFSVEKAQQIVDLFCARERIERSRYLKDVGEIKLTTKWAGPDCPLSLSEVGEEGSEGQGMTVSEAIAQGLLEPSWDGIGKAVGFCCDPDKLAFHLFLPVFDVPAVRIFE